MEAGGEAGEEIANKAVPDGCIELILRDRGRSSWDGPQTERFVAGLCSVPAELTMSGDATFTGIRLWPWAWNMLGEPPCPGLHDRWIPLDPSSAGAQLLGDGSHVVERLLDFFATRPVPEIGQHVPHCGSPGELAERTGVAPRRLQRWFQREIGLAPRQYFRLLRFQHAVGEHADASPRQTDRAADAGYADQAHMTREFRRLSGETPARQRKSAVGPFLSPSDS